MNSKPKHEKLAFGGRLQALLKEKGWSQSDLARAAYGLTTDKDGYKVAKHRDRISAYVRGEQYPDPVNLKLVADALGVPEEDLMPEVDYDTDEPPSALVFEMKKLLPMDVIHDIMTVLIRNKTRIDRLNKPAT